MYITQQINQAAKNNISELFLSKNSYGKLLEHLRNEIDRSLVCFSPFYSDIAMLQRGIENICIYTNSKRMTICSM